MKDKIEYLLRLKDIIWYKTLADLKAEGRRTYLGFIWFLLEPLLHTFILYLVFGVLTGGNRGIDRVPCLLVGILIWQWCEGSIMTSMTTINEKAHIMQMIALPKFLFPIISIFVQTIKFLFVFFVIASGINFLGFTINFYYIFLIFMIPTGMVLSAGISLPFSVASVYFPETNIVIGACFRLIFFISGIFFSPNRVPNHLLGYFYLNPFACIISNFRSVLVNGTFPDFGLLIYTFLFGSILLIIGLFLCITLDKKILKYVKAG
jgi:ABC-type polysaccharide/polyol phosphate export permease